MIIYKPCSHGLCCACLWMLTYFGVVPQSGSTAAHVAAGKGHIAILRVLVENGKADANLATLSVSGRYPHVTSRVCQLKKTPLTEAVEKGHLECVRFLVAEAKVDVNTRSPVRRVPLVPCAG